MVKDGHVTCHVTGQRPLVASCEGSLGVERRGGGWGLLLGERVPPACLMQNERIHFLGIFKRIRLNLK